MEDPRRQLAALLEKYKVPNDCIKYMTASPDHPTDKGIGFKSISDFASAFTEGDYAAGVKELISERWKARRATSWQWPD